MTKEVEGLLLQELGRIARRIQLLQQQEDALRTQIRFLRVRRETLQKRLDRMKRAERDPQAALRDKFDDEAGYVEGEKKGTRDGHLQ